MSGFYALAYAIGFRPWEQAGRQAAEEFSGLLDREISQRPAPPGQAADLGCGTGARAIELAGRGWQATGIDNQPRALRIARRPFTLTPRDFLAYAAGCSSCSSSLRTASVSSAVSLPPPAVR